MNLLNSIGASGGIPRPRTEKWEPCGSIAVVVSWSVRPIFAMAAGTMWRASFSGGTSADVSTHVHLYVDGQLESASGSREGSVSGGKIARFSMGTNLDRELPLFEGWIDEVHIFRGNVSPIDIQRLVSDAKLP